MSTSYATERLKMRLRQRYTLSSTCRTARGRAETAGGARVNHRLRREQDSRDKAVVAKAAPAPTLGVA